MTTADELREMSDEQLHLTIKDATDGLFRMRIQSQTERTNAPSKMKEFRRLVARVKTIQRQRELAAEPGK